MTVTMPIGRMDRRITIQELTQGVGAEYGEPTETWADFATVWANVYNGGGHEFEQARQITAEIDTQFQIRYMPGITNTMRISYEGRLYDIHRIDEVGRRRRLNLWCKARQE